MHINVLSILLLLLASCNTSNFHRTPLEIKGSKKGLIIYSPEIIKRAPLIYPTEASKKKIEGTVVIECTITKQGKAANFVILKSIPELNKAAIESLKNYKFLPALNEKKEPFEIKWQIPFTFSLSN